MSFFRSVMLLIIVPLLLAAVFLFLGSRRGSGITGGGYAVLAADASIEDRTLRGLLEAGSDSYDGEIICESAQWVMLDVFGSLETVPLDEYSARINSFDPRNDGYAAKLKDVFVRDGKRFVYIPVKAGGYSVAMLDKQLNALLKDIPFSVDYYGIGEPVFLFFAVFAAASLCLAVICFVKRKSHYGVLGIITLLPLLSSLAFFGTAGIAAAALLLGLFSLLREPFNDLAALSFINKTGTAKKFKLIYKEIIKPYRLYWFLLPVFAASLAAVVIFSRLNVLFLLAVLAVSSAIFFFSLKTITFIKNNRRLFNPVVIMKRRFIDFSFSVYMLPFIIAAFSALFIAPYFSGGYVSNGKIDTLIDEQDYYAHLMYQSAFSTRQIGTSSGAFPNYFFDKDGLPSMTETQNLNVDTDDFPSFPLKNLMDFFNGVNSGEKTGSAGVAGSTGSEVEKREKLSLLALLIFIFPLFLIKRKDNYMSKIRFSGLKFYGVKKKTPDMRLSGIKRTGKNAFKNNNQPCVRKEA